MCFQGPSHRKGLSARNAFLGHPREVSTFVPRCVASYSGSGNQRPCHCRFIVTFPGDHIPHLTKESHMSTLFKKSDYTVVSDALRACAKRVDECGDNAEEFPHASLIALGNLLDALGSTCRQSCKGISLVLLATLEEEEG